VERADSPAVGLQDVLERIRAASAELARVKETDEVAERALLLALEITSSSVAFIGLADENGNFDRVYSRSTDTSQAAPPKETERLIASARSNTHKSIRGEELLAGGENLGMIGIARDTSYSTIESRAFAIFAQQVASSLHIGQLRRRRQDMVSALVNLRAELERAEKDRLLAAEQAKSARRVERAHELTVEALLAISVHARSGVNLADFYRRLTANIAELVGASRVLFWQVDQNGMLGPISGAHGIDEAFISRFKPLPCGPELDDMGSQVVFKDSIFRATTSDDSEENLRILRILGVASAISVPWRAGDQRLGLVAAYDSLRPEGFSREDSWVLQKAGLAAGLVWQLKLAEADLKETVERLEKVDAARQMLLKTVSSAVDNERKRFASELHDDALQKLTAAELHLQRVGDSEHAPSLALARSLLGQTEDALRRLLFEVRPPALETPGGLQQSIHDRLEILSSLTGIEAEVELDLPDALSYEFKSIVFRQLAEALTNVEKHAGATHVQLRLTTRDGGVHGLIEDNGRGFVVAERNNLPGHLGLLAVKERALMAGGWYKIESQPGLGTRIEFWMPTTR
jgi:signal transduction histidine kinase